MKITEILTHEVYDAKTGELVFRMGLISEYRLKVDGFIETQPNTPLRRIVDEIKAVKGADR